MNKLMTKTRKESIAFLCHKHCEAKVKEPLFTQKIILLIKKKIIENKKSMMLYALKTVYKTRTDTTIYRSFLFSPCPQSQ